MEGVFNLVPLVILAPLAGLLLNLLIGRRLSERAIAYIAVGAALIAFIVAAVLALGLTSHPEGSIVHIADWIKLPASGVDIAWEFRVDTLSVTMMLVVAGVGALIHIYAVGYMHGDPRFARFFIYMNLFLTSMLTLVSASNFLVLFVGWELVGLCSFLLIGFWLHRDTPDPETGETAGYKNSAAAKKAFIVNRIGDFGFILAILLLWWTFGTLDYGPVGGAEHGDSIHEASEEADAPESFIAPDGLCVPNGEGVFTMVDGFVAAQCDVDLGGQRVPIGTLLTVVTLLMLLGVAGKSAQIPLFVWLPDAMAGPTPVSALIHAATMVTAGVYLVARSNLLYEAARGVQVLPLGLTSSDVLTLVGALTAFMAGTVALAQWDIKRVLAFSTVSQLGFMVAAVGLGGYVAGMFHLVTHSFFKALLFMSAGSVIHGVEHGHQHGERKERAFGYKKGVLDPQDMRNMGGLRKKMPATFAVYVVGALALAGIFPLAGFWSKDEILLDAYLHGSDHGSAVGWIALILLLVAALFTAFYMGRQVFMIFFGAPRSKAAEHARESAPVMIWPLIVLAVLSVIGGFLNVPGAHPFGKWLEKSVYHAHSADFNITLALFALALAGGAVGLAYLLYYRRPALNTDGTDPIEGRLGRLWAFLHGRWYWDEAYAALVAAFDTAGNFLAVTLDWNFWHDFFHEKVIYGGFNTAASFLGAFDLGFIDRIVNSTGPVMEQIADRLRRLQTGFVRNYALGVLIGVILILITMVLPFLAGR